jgi:plastocyanin
MKPYSWIALLVCLPAAALAGTVQVTVLDRDGQPVTDAVVVLAPAAQGGLRAPLAAQTTIVQEKMRFVPEVTLVPVGAKVRFVNNDPWDHHVRSSPAGAGQFGASQAGFELRLEGKSDGKPPKGAEVTLDKPGAQSAVLLGCFLHGSMRGHIFVTDSPWAAKTGADGTVSFTDVPDGSAQVRVWQADQLGDLPPRTVTVGAAPARASVQLSVVPRRRRT